MTTNDKDAPSRVTNTDVELVAQIAFEAMAKPGVLEGLREIANKEGISLDIVRDTLVAMTLRHVGEPVPPDLRERLMANYPTLATSLRKMIIEPDLT